MTDVNKLEAGRELDALIAEKVMGHKLERSKETIWEEVPIPGTKDGIVTSELRYYSISMHAAWKVVERVATLRTSAGDKTNGQIYKPVIRLELYEHDDQYEARLGRCKGCGDDDIVASGFEPVDAEPRDSYMERAMCLMICRLALKAVGA